MSDNELLFVASDVSLARRRPDHRGLRRALASTATPCMIVFDDSSPANQEKYFPLLEQTRTHNDLFYVGPREGTIPCLSQRPADGQAAGIARQESFRPSYGGNRNYTLMYTLGGLMVSADDDMRPYALMEDSPESLNDDEVCRGRLYKGTKTATPASRSTSSRPSWSLGQAGQRGARQLRTRRLARRHRDGPGNQRTKG